MREIISTRIQARNADLWGALSTIQGPHTRPFAGDLSFCYSSRHNKSCLPDMRPISRLHLKTIVMIGGIWPKGTPWSFGSCFVRPRERERVKWCLSISLFITRKEKIGKVSDDSKHPLVLFSYSHLYFIPAELVDSSPIEKKKREEFATPFCLLSFPLPISCETLIIPLKFSGNGTNSLWFKWATWIFSLRSKSAHHLSSLRYHLLNWTLS